MLNNLKALVVILALGWVVFYLARPLCLRYMSTGAFVRRRNVWFALTAIGFLSPAFWVYALFAIVLLSWAGAREENPLALYVLVTFVVPDARFFLPTILVNQLFDLTQTRLLSLVVLIPAIVRSWNDPLRSADNRFRAADWFLLSFLVLQVVVQVPYESVTASMRRSFLLAIDIFVLFYAFSRLPNRQRLSEVVACFWLACAVMAPIGVFEWAKGWHLYTGLSSLWGDPDVFAYSLRGGGLRARAATKNTLYLGELLAISLGLFLYLRSRTQRKLFDWAVIGVFAAGMFATGSRGAWVMAIIIVCVFVLSRPGAAKRMAGTLVAGALLIGVMYATPLKESVIDRMPIIGNTDQDTVEYRQRLFDISIPLIRQNPFFGDPFVTRNMESMRQGQGIIDLVNGYLFSALFYGLVGLSLQMAAVLGPLWMAVTTFWRVRGTDDDAGLLGNSLVAVFLGVLFFIATAGFDTVVYLLAGLMTSYAYSVRQVRSTWQESQAPQRIRPRGLA